MTRCPPRRLHQRRTGRAGRATPSGGRGGRRRPATQRAARAPRARRVRRRAALPRASTSDGREMLCFIPGEAAIEPLRAVGADRRGAGQRGRAAAPLPRRRRVVRRRRPTRGRSPCRRAFRDGMISHNDPNLDNVIFAGGRAVALIDFDLASPGSAVWDVACAARLWAPLRDPARRARAAARPLARAPAAVRSTPTGCRQRERGQGRRRDGRSPRLVLPNRAWRACETGMSRSSACGARAASSGQTGRGPGSPHTAADAQRCS